MLLQKSSLFNFQLRMGPQLVLVLMQTLLHSQINHSHLAPGETSKVNSYYNQSRFNKLEGHDEFYN